MNKKPEVIKQSMLEAELKAFKVNPEELPRQLEQVYDPEHPGIEVRNLYPIVLDLVDQIAVCPYYRSVKDPAVRRIIFNRKDGPAQEAYVKIPQRNVFLNEFDPDNRKEMYLSF